MAPISNLYHDQTINLFEELFVLPQLSQRDLQMTLLSLQYRRFHMKPILHTYTTSASCFGSYLCIVNTLFMLSSILGYLCHVCMIFNRAWIFPPQPKCWKTLITCIILKLAYKKHHPSIYIVFTDTPIDNHRVLILGHDMPSIFLLRISCFPMGVCTITTHSYFGTHDVKSLQDRGI